MRHASDLPHRDPAPPVGLVVAAVVVAVACTFLLARPAFGQDNRFVPTATPASPSGVRATADLPATQHMRNVGGRDGAGLCVFTSIQHAAYWQSVHTLDGFREYMRSQLGGGYPSKVDAMLAAFCRQKGVPVPPYAQHTGGDDSFLELALRTDRMPSVTYDGRDDFYRSNVYHMVNLSHLDSTRAAIIDNNRPGLWLWMSRADFLGRWRGSGGGWAVVLLDPPPPPYTDAPAAAVRHEWVGTGPAPADFTAGRGCGCKGVGACECGPGCRCVPTAGPVFGQCGPGGCRVVPSYPQPFTPAPAPDEPPPDITPILAGQGKGGAWVPDQRGGYGYWVAGRRVLDLDTAGDVRRTNAHGIGVGDPIDAPGVELPPGVRPLTKTKTGEAIPPGGVVPHLIHDAPAYSLSGRPCTKQEAHDAIGAGTLSDDSDRWHLTAVGDAATCAKLRADVASLPAELRGKLLVQCYSPSDWPVSQFKLPTGVSLRAPSPGRVSAQVGAVGSAEYTAGTTSLSDLLSVAGGPTPKPVPPPPPKPNDPAPAPNPAPAPITPPVVPLWVLALGALLIWFRR